MHPWVPVIITVALGVCGLGVQGLLLAYFLGRMKENQLGQEKLVTAFQDFTAQTLQGLMERLQKFDSLAADSQTDRTNINARLMGLERATDGLPKFREDFAGFAATSRAHQERTESELQRMARGMEGLQRQIAELAIHGPGQLVELPRKGVAPSHD